MTYFVNERLTGSRLPSIYHGDSFHHRQSIDQMLEEDLGNISNISPDNINSPLELFWAARTGVMGLGPTDVWWNEKCN